MQAFTAFWNQAMSLAVLGGGAAVLVLAYALLMADTDIGRSALAFVRKYILGIGFVVSLSAVVSSLVYSEIIGFPPCLFCWYARVFFYPQVVLFSIALWRRDRSILPYALALSVIGLAISTFHYLIESFQYSPIPCAAGGVSCLTRYVYEYGFITIPLMGLVGFAVMVVALLAARRGSAQPHA